MIHENMASNIQTEMMLNPRKVETILEERASEVGKPWMREIDSKFTPILVGLMINGVEPFFGEEHTRYAHTTYLYKWLIEPSRTEREFTYVIGPLKWHVNSKLPLNEIYQFYAPVNIIAAEALATICPIIEGNWEIPVWELVKKNGIKYGGKGGSSVGLRDLPS